MNQKKVVRRQRAMERFYILSRIQWGAKYGVQISEQEYSAYVKRKTVELLSLSK